MFFPVDFRKLNTSQMMKSIFMLENEIHEMSRMSITRCEYKENNRWKKFEHMCIDIDLVFYRQENSFE